MSTPSGSQIPALPDTGSGTTIHKYLRKIETEEGGRKAGVSVAIQALVTQAADQLQGEAATEVEAVRVRMAERQKAHEHVQAALGSQLAGVRQSLKEAAALATAPGASLPKAGPGPTKLCRNPHGSPNVALNSGSEAPCSKFGWAAQKGAIPLEERLAKLDKAAFGSKKSEQADAQAAEAD